MLLPARMKRVEIIVHKNRFESVLRYLREARVLELLDVKDMLKGYQGAVSPCPTSEKLYRLVTIASKVTNVTNALQIGAVPPKAVTVAESLDEEKIAELENRLAVLEKEVSTLSSEIQACERVTEFAEKDLGDCVRAMRKISDLNAPETRQQLEELIAKIFDALPPEEMTDAETLADLTRKTITDSAKRAMVDQVASDLGARRSEAALVQTISRILDLKIAAGATAARMKFESDSRIEKTRERAAQLRVKARELGSQNSEWLQVTGELVNADRILEEARNYCGKTETTYVIEGWLPANQIPRIQAGLSQISNSECVIQEWSGKNSPTMLRNPRGAGLFEKLTLGFGTPGSSEIDPTILWFVTYPLFFGLMFGDVGHGLVFMLLSIGLFYAKRKGVKFKEQSFGGLGGLFNMILAGSGLLVLGGAAATVCGFLYGTVMGSEEWFRELTGLPGPLWFEPFTHPMTLLKVSIVIGIAHVSSGLVLDIVNKIKNKEYDQVLAGPGLWLWFYLTLAYLILAHGFGLITYVLSNFPTALLLLGVPSALMLAARVRMDGPFEGFGHWMECMLASISHTISYIRIMAMKMIHDVFSILFLGILFAMPIYISAPIFGMLTLIMILVLESAFVFLQDLRLHWVEWFLKFYSGSGIRFQPFGVQRTYTKVSIAV